MRYLHTKMLLLCCLIIKFLLRSQIWRSFKMERASNRMYSKCKQMMCSGQMVAVSVQVISISPLRVV